MSHKLFFTKEFFANISAIYDVKFEGIQNDCLHFFHCKRRLSILGSIDSIGNEYFVLWYGILNEGFEVANFV